MITIKEFKPIPRPSVKEFTTQEIAELNQTFDSANASTKWKFMQTKEYKQLPDAVRYTVEKECLTHYFNVLTDGMGNWKMPFTAEIKSDLYEAYDAACRYFTGAPLQIVSECADEYQCYCAGYYEAIGA